MRLTSLLAGSVPSRWLVAWSGGVDSSVLLHALCQIRGRYGVPIVAIHVNHGLQDAATEWASFCAASAQKLGCEFICLDAHVRVDSGGGPEAAARDARYAVLRDQLEPGDWLLTAHHEQDQAETMLLNLLRGSSVAGLAGIGETHEFGSGRLARPLLDVPHADLLGYAAQHNVAWRSDPSNDDVRLDRNYLRHEIFPRLAKRWPAVARQFAQSARFAGESSALQGDLASIDAGVHPAINRLSLAKLGTLSSSRQRNLIRHVAAQQGLGPVPKACLLQIVDELIPAKPDAQPLVRWTGGEARRYRRHLFLLPPLAALPKLPTPSLLDAGEGLDLGPGMGVLKLSGRVRDGIDPRLAARGLTVRYREGGERIRPPGQTCSHQLKKLLQQKGILPWMRDRLPLLYSETRLVAVADLWIDAESAVNHGLDVHWQDSPTVI